VKARILCDHDIVLRDRLHVNHANRPVKDQHTIGAYNIQRGAVLREFDDRLQYRVAGFQLLAGSSETRLLPRITWMRTYQSGSSLTRLAIDMGTLCYSTAQFRRELIQFYTERGVRLILVFVDPLTST
jgi:hypothetical protein